MRMFRLEIKRILKSQQTIIIMSIGILLSIVMAYFPIAFEEINYIDLNGNKISVRGLDAIQYKKSIRSSNDGTVTADKIYSALKIYQDVLNKNGGKEEALPLSIYTEKISPIKTILFRASEVFADSSTGIGANLQDIPLNEIGNYYEQCSQHLDDMTKLEYKNNVDVQLKAKLMYNKVDKPFMLYGGLSRDSFDYIIINILFLLVFCTVIAASTFSEGYQNGSDSIFRCSRNGRLRLALIKIGALFLIITVYFLFCMIVQLTIINFAFGIECLKTSVQMLFSAISLVPYNLGELQLVVVAGGLLSLLATVSFSLFVSSRCRTSMISTSISLAVCFAPMIIYSMTDNTLFSYILPSSGIGMQNSLLYQLCDIKFTKVAGMYLWSPIITVCVALIELLLFSYLAIRAYCKHEVV